MMYLYIAIALLVGLLLGKALFGKKAAAPTPVPAPVAAAPAAPQEDADEIAAVIAIKQRKSFFIRSKLGLVFYTEDKKISVIKKGFSLIK